MKESFSFDHCCELITNSLENSLDGSGIANESHGHLEALVGYITDSSLNIVGDPFYEGRGVPIHDVHLLYTYF